MRVLVKHNVSVQDFQGIRGISLIEVIIAVAIVAIIAAFVFPWYGDYQRRATVSEGLSLATSGKAEVEELVSIGQLKIGIPKPSPWVDPAAGLTVISDNPTSQVRAIVRVGSVIIVTYKNDLLPSPSRKPYSLILYGNGSTSAGTVSWTCLAGEKATSLLALVKAVASDSERIGEALPLSLAPGPCRSGMPSPASSSSSEGK